MSGGVEVKSFFDFVNDLTYGKKYLLDETSISKYEPFMVNRALSQNVDTIMYANEMNKFPSIDKHLQHDFYYYIVSKKKRYGKWAKADNINDEILNLITKHYKVNKRHAIQYFELMNETDIEQLKIKYDVGGLSK